MVQRAVGALHAVLAEARHLSVRHLAAGDAAQELELAHLREDARAFFLVPRELGRCWGRISDHGFLGWD